MKKGRFKLICIFILCACLVAGGTMTAVGLLLGAGNEEKENDMISDGDVLFKGTDMDIQNLEISLGFMEAEIKEGNTFSVTGFGIDKDKLKVKNDNGTLKIENNQHSVWKLFRPSVKLGHKSIGSNPAKVVITIPKGTKFGNVSLETGAGTLTASGIICDTLDVDLGAGQGTLSSISVTNHAEVEVGMGTLTLASITSGKLKMDCGMGEIVMNGTVLESCAAECGMGSIVMKLTGNIEDYRYSVDCGMGSVTLNDEDYSGFAKSGKAGNGTKPLDLECGMGSIDVTIE